MPADTARRTRSRARAPSRSGLAYAALALLALFLVVMVGIPLFVGLRNVWRAVASTGWPTTDGVVVDASEVASTTDGRDADGRVRETRMTEGRVTVQYRVDERAHTTSRLYFGEWSASGDATWAQLRLLRHPVGARVRVSYAPSDPELAVVHAGLTPAALLAPGIGLGLLALVALVYRARGGSGGSLRRVFTTACGLAGAAALGVGVLRVWRAHASAGWPTARGVVVYGPGAADYVPRRDAVPLVYRYEVDGRAYFSDVRAFGAVAAARRGGWVERVAARYPAGAPVVVHYAAGSPERSVLEPGIPREAWLLPGVGVVLLLVGFAGAAADGGKER